jgi:rhamnose transport system ATP-binding protein
MHLAHRTVVMRRGRQVAEFARGQADAEALVAAASGLALTQPVTAPHHTDAASTRPLTLKQELAA